MSKLRIDVVLCWSVLVATSSATPECNAAMSSATPECLDHSREKLAELRRFTVTEDVHDKITGNYTVTWGPEVIFSADNSSCIKFSREKVNDYLMVRSMYARSEWFGGEKIMNMTLEKLENGVYLMRKEGVAKSKLYILYAKDNVVVHYACMITPRSSPNRPYLAFKTAVLVPTRELRTPLDPRVQGAVDEAVQMIQGAPGLLGKIVQYNYPC